MYKHECYKIFTRKSSYVVFALVLALMVYAERVPADWNMASDIYEELYEELGGPVSEEKESYVREQMEASDAQELGIYTEEDRIAGEVYYLVSLAGLGLQENTARQNELKEQMDRLSASRYDYRVAEKELGMLKEVESSYGFYIVQAWLGMFHFIEPFFSVILLAILILIGLSPVFADEFTQRTTGLILATKNGKRHLVTAKLMAAVTYIVTIFLSLHVFNFILQLNKYGGIQGWNAPIQSLKTASPYSNYFNSPFAWEVWQFYAVTLSVQFFGSVAFALVVLSASVFTRNALVTFFVSGVVLGLPRVMNVIGSEYQWAHFLTSFSYMETLRIERLFSSFNAYNVLGQPILYPVLQVIIYTIISVCLIGFIYRVFRKHQVSY
ncbi:hypothetical protein ACERJO_05910 [Halalkalibacter sp. AB-rgal2]|uniref:hypothetical protein n=1 Tax=Halalkalibacter sp. AB-rgal2 TaxID=3242695 RepID=UPI00359DB43E